MRHLFRTLTVVTALGALAPLAAHADNVGLQMYQPSPLIVHAQQPQHHARTALNTHAKAAINGQTNVSQRNG